MNNEVWKSINKFYDYQISNMGRVKSFKCGNERILKPGKDKDGYLIVSLYKNKKPYTKSIHRLVLEAFKLNKDLNKTECNHIDGNKENNRLDNLEWCTHSENIKHAYKLGLKRAEGENHPRSKLTNQNVIQIKLLLSYGLTHKKISKMFGVRRETISKIKRGERWNHIKLLKGEIRMVTNEVIKQIFNNKELKNKCIDNISLLLYNDQSVKWFSSDAGECPIDLKTIKGCNKIAEEIIESIFCK